jgi:hypothetical protein
MTKQDQAIITSMRYRGLQQGFLDQQETNAEDAEIFETELRFSMEKDKNIMFSIDTEY